MDKKTFFHKVSQMRAAQREYFKTRSSAALASSKLLERQIAVLKEIAVDYSGKTIDNIIQQLEAIKKDVTDED